MEGRQEGVEPLDRAHDLSSLSGEVEAVARGDRSMQQCRWTNLRGSGHDTEVVAAALSTETLAVSERQAARVLGELVDAGLLEVASPHADRWRLHDLIRLFARDKAREMTPAAREDAIRRALAVYLRRVRTHRELLSSPAARLDPAAAARARAEIDRDLAAGAPMVDRAAAAGIDLLTVVGGELVDALLDAITEWPEAIRGHDAAAAIADGAARRGNLALAARANAWLANHPLFAGQVHVTGSGLTPGELVLVDVDGRNIGFVNADRHGQVNGSVQLPPQPFPHREATAVGQTSGIAAHAILS